MTHNSAKLVDIEGIYVCLSVKTAVILLSLMLRFVTNHIIRKEGTDNMKKLVIFMLAAIIFAACNKPNEKMNKCENAEMSRCD